ncbi:MAG TPA: hypothetical protein VGP79_07530 [Bryobacteraceae bacterium]|jgi:hypothetical protein|nr:hypothetical protein [Bryobacteraceae bacterium]
MQPTLDEQELLEAFRKLPPAAAKEVSALTKRLAELGAAATINWSDEWSDEDLEAFTADSARRIDEHEMEDTR